MTTKIYKTKVLEITACGSDRDERYTYTGYELPDGRVVELGIGDPDCLWLSRGDIEAHGDDHIVGVKTTGVTVELSVDTVIEADRAYRSYGAPSLLTDEERAIEAERIAQVHVRHMDERERLEIRLVGSADGWRDFVAGDWRDGDPDTDAVLRAIEQIVIGDHKVARTAESLRDPLGRYWIRPPREACLSLDNGATWYDADDVETGYCSQIAEHRQQIWRAIGFDATEVLGAHERSWMQGDDDDDLRYIAAYLRAAESDIVIG